ncbi:L-arabinose ABC transporter permease AraH [Nibricoccus aquaticus]|uniref:L-arabinose ABC transporter permease AraH n=1 Tax=Nibricoccus aquaticus TaxID=2576891 RepID=A0A290QGC3_9BACT|nr:L-arabinose ABC transporter permease AraH [Nibricoccus aquaticus]ATC64378.1 L-arabinose ABC transporter permease AraH [Nibricoccus aquaticus]
MSASAPSTAASAKPSTTAAFLDRAGMLLILAALILVCSFAVPNFASPNNAESVLLAVSTVGIVATTMLFCLASGNFDLSVGTIIPAGGVLCALILRDTGNLPLAIAGSLGFGAIVGLINGVVVAKFKINPLITTLSTMMMVKGLAFAFADSRSIGISHDGILGLANAAFPVIHNDRGGILFQITAPVWICFGLFGLFGFLLQRTTFGRNTLAVGGNEEAARLAGIPVDRVKITIFVLQGAIAALAGTLLAARMGIGDPKVAPGIELSIISACVLGGVSLSGGIGRMSYVIAGVFIMGIVENAMNLLNIKHDYQYIVRGAILLSAVLFDRFRQNR